MRIFISFLFFVFVSLPAVAQEDVAVAPDLEAFGQEVIEVFASGDKAAYMSILHPECPAPDAGMLAWKLSRKWQPAKADQRVRDFADAYDRTVLEFLVEPEERALEFQVWTLKPDGREGELVTGYPVAIHDGAFKILDYPCFKPKE